MPSTAIRCPTCGHSQGEPVIVEKRSAIGTNRRRDLLLVGGVVVVLVGFLVFTGDGGPAQSETAASSAPTSTTRRETTTTRSTSTTTTVPSTTTTTTLPGLQLGGPSGVRLLVRSNSGPFILDLDTGERTSIYLTEGYGVTVAGGVVLQSLGEARFFPEPYSESSTSLGRGDTIFASSEPDRVWIVAYLEEGIEVREVKTDGATTAGPFQFDHNNGGPGGTVHDGLVLSKHGSIYVVGRDGSMRRVALGDALLAGGNSILHWTCDDVGACGVTLLDLDTGRSTPVSGIASASPYQFGPAQVSEGGRYAALYDGSYEAGVALRLVDLETGAVQTVTDSGSPGGLLTFSRDAEWLFFGEGFRVVAHRIATGESFALELGSNEISLLVAV